MISPGKIITKLGIECSDKDKEVFYRLFLKDEICLNNAGLRFELVRGEDIRKYYNEKYYNTKGGGTLNSSCMRYNSCEDYFDIYTENSDIVSLLVLFNIEGKVEGRALVWNCCNISKDEEIVLLDRIYTTNDSYCEFFTNHAKKNGWGYKFRNSSSCKEEIVCPPDYNMQFLKLKVDLGNSQFDYYPYIDTFTHKENNVLTNYSTCFSIPLEYTEGGDTQEYNYSDWFGEDIPVEDSVYSGYLNDYLWDNRSVEVKIGKNYDNLPDDHEDIVRINNKWYHTETSCDYSEYKGEWILKEEAIYLYYISDYATEDDICYSDFEDMHILVSDAVYSNYHNSEMIKFKCKLIENDWIHIDSVDEYLENIKEEEDAEAIIN